MKRVWILTLTIVLLTYLTACKQQTPAVPFSLNADGITGINLSNGKKTTSLERIEDCIPIVDALNKAKPIGATVDNVSLPSVQYTFTILKENGQPTDTVSVYTDTYLQIGTGLYQGSFTPLINLLEQHFTATDFEIIINAISTNADSCEVAFQLVETNQFKLITNPKHIKKLLNKLASLKPIEHQQSVAAKEQYKIYLRPQNAKTYDKPIIIENGSNGSVMRYGNYYCALETVNLDKLFEALPYNIILP